MKRNAGHRFDSVAAREVMAPLTVSAAAAWLLTLASASVVLAVTYYATYELNGGAATESGQIYSAGATDTSGVWATNSGVLTLKDCIITTTGNSSSVNTSSQYGLNAGVLADTKGRIVMSGGSVTTSGSGANGLFATGSGAAITMSDGAITTTGSAAHGVDATYGGSITLTNVDVSTVGESASAGLSTDYGGGTVTVTGGTVTTAGSKSPAIYSTGVITVSNAKLVATGGGGGVIDGANSIILTNTSVQGKTYGVKVHRTAKSSGTATVSMTGGSLTATAGDAFLFAAQSGALTASVTLKGGVAVSAASGCLVDATTGSTVTFTADGETLTGSLIADGTSAITAALNNGTALTGMTTKAALTVDSTSTWVVPSASTLTSLTTSGTVSLDPTTSTVTATGAAKLGGMLIVNAGIAPSVGVYPLIQAGSISGAFSGLTLSPALPFDLAATLDYSSTTMTLNIVRRPISLDLSRPWGLVFDSSNKFCITDSNAQTVLAITSAGVTAALAGVPGLSGSVDANGADARFNGPTGIAVDSNDNIYVADSNNNTIRKISPAGVVTTLAGTAGLSGSADANGAEARFNGPTGIAVDGGGDVYVADSNNNTIRIVTPAGAVTTLAGQAGVSGSIDANGVEACFNCPAGIAIDGGGDLYVADSNNNTIRRITPAGVVTTFAGSAGHSGHIDGTGTAALFNRPCGLVFDSLGNLYVADTGNHVIRLVTPAGVVSTVAGRPGVAGLEDGAGTTALFNQPTSLAFDVSGNLYIADAGNGVIRRITPAGDVATVLP